MDYSFFCNFCGDYFTSKNKNEVKEYLKKHKIIIESSGQIFKICKLLPTKAKTMARPAIVNIINELFTRKEANVRKV